MCVYEFDGHFFVLYGHSMNQVQSENVLNEGKYNKVLYQKNINRMHNCDV